MTEEEDRQLEPARALFFRATEALKNVHYSYRRTASVDRGAHFGGMLDTEGKLADKIRTRALVAFFKSLVFEKSENPTTRALADNLLLIKIIGQLGPIDTAITVLLAKQIAEIRKPAARIREALNHYWLRWLGSPENLEEMLKDAAKVDEVLDDFVHIPAIVKDYTQYRSSKMKAPGQP